MIKKRLGAVLLSLVVLFTVFAASPVAVQAATVKPTKIALNATKRTLYTGEVYRLSVNKAKPKNAKTSVKWTTSNKSIATVSQTGLVLAKPVKKTLKVKITATSTLNKKVRASAIITVKKGTANKSITLNKKTYAMKVGGAATLKVSKWSPQNTTVKKLAWASGNKKIATVSATGVVKALGKGTVKITATNTYGKKATCTITVAPKATTLPAPAVPKNLTSRATTAEVALSWDAASGATGYEVYRGTTQSGSYTRIKTTSATSFTDSEPAGTGLRRGVAYYYKVRAYKTQSGKTAYSGYSNIENNGVISVSISFGGGSWGRENGQDVSFTQQVTVSTSGGRGSDISIVEYLTSTYAPHRGETDRTSSTRTVSQIGQSFTFNRTLHLYNNGPQSSNLMTYHVNCEGAANAKGYNYCSGKFTRQGNWGNPYNPGW